MKKVLIFHTAIGLGHKSMAENIAAQLKEAGLEVKLADIGSVQRGRFEHIVVAVHKFINLYLPFVWAWLYFWGHYIIYPFRTIIAGFNCAAAKKLISEYNPDLIISTQTTGSAVVAYLKSKRIYKNLFGIAFSDYHLHPYWLYKEADFYLANIIEQKQEMVKKGIAPEKIFVCGMSLKARAVFDGAQVKQKLGISSAEKVILVGSGSLGTGFNEGLITRLLTLPGVKVVVLCGKNEDYKKYLEQKFRGQNILALGFYQPMAELYSIADIFYSKPGGLTTAEALQYGLTMVVTHTLPGQEDQNLKYLLNKNLVEKVSQDILAQARDLLAKQKPAIYSQSLEEIVNPKTSAKAAVLKILS
ncbi:MAG: hypothetical protein HY918_04395 [Candidatus Doudnabacteria bacterium]|nr:hypothetical protein [Candidatus Doudnabacteria bacterium]